MNKRLGVGFLAVSASLLTGCMGPVWGNWNQVRQDFHYSYHLAPGSRLTVDNHNGRVEIVGWERDAIEINGTKYADSQEHLGAVRIDAEPSGNAFTIRTVGPSTSGWGGHYGANYVIRVPRRTVLDRITSGNGAIRIESIDSPAHLQTSNGAIDVTRLAGALDAHTSNGRVQVHDLKGAATIHTSNGAIDLDEVRGQIDAVTSNGHIKARLDDPAPNQMIRAETSNGGVDLTLTAIRDNPIRIRTSNSAITLRLPASVNGQVSASTSNSSITTEFDINVHGHLDKHHIEGAIGSGGPVISLSTSNGSIKLLKL